MTGNIGELLFRNQLRQQGYYFVDVPLDHRYGPSIVAVKCATGKVYMIDTSSQGTVYEFPLTVPVTTWATSTTHRALHSAPDIKTNTIARTKRPLICTVCSTPVDVIFDHHECRMDLDYPDYSPPTPASADSGFADADVAFNDHLFMGLQGDILPAGSSALDDYLNANTEARSRIFMDAAMGNQGCSCEQTDLDRYLDRHRELLSAITIRATVSDECKKMIQEPVNTMNVDDRVLRMQSQIGECSKLIQKLSESLAVPMRVSPFDNGRRVSYDDKDYGIE